MFKWYGGRIYFEDFLPAPPFQKIIGIASVKRIAYVVITEIRNAWDV